jgi:amidase
VQASEIWQEHGEWATQHLHEFGPGIKERFEIAKSLDPKMIEQALKEKALIENKIRKLLTQHSNDSTEAVLLLPSTGCIAPLLNSSPIELEQIRKQLFQLLCIAGLGGVPQINLPVCEYEDAPLGLSLMANTNQDLLLLKLASNLKAHSKHKLS